MTLSRQQAAAIAWTVYGTEQPAVVELLLLGTNAPDRVERYRAMRALQWFAPEDDVEPSPRVPDPPTGEVARALECLEWVIRGWRREDRVAAAAGFAEAARELVGAP